MIIIYSDIKVNTRKLGRLTFSTLKSETIRQAAKFFDKVPGDRDAFLQVLYTLAKEPKASFGDLRSLSDPILERIGRELLIKSHLDDRYKKLKRQRGNFFVKFRTFFKALVEDQIKSQKQRMKLVSPQWKTDFDLLSKTTYSDSLYERIKHITGEQEHFQEYLKSSQSLLDSLGFAKNMMSDLQGREDYYKKLMDTIEPVAEKADELLKSSIPFYYKDDFMGKIGMAESLFIEREMLYEQSTFDRYLLGELPEMIKSSSRVVEDLESLYVRSTIDEIKRYQELWDNIKFRGFIETPMDIVDKYLRDVEKSEEVSNDHLKETRSALEYLKQWKDRLPPLSAKAMFLLAEVIADCSHVALEISDRIKSGNLTPESGAVLIVQLYFRVVLVIYAILKKE